MEWEYLGEGGINTAYINKTRTEVFKRQHRSTSTDLPERSVQLWNLINDHIQPPARIQTIDGLGAGWVCPFIEGEAATDEEIQHAVIDIFNKTGRIVVDAMLEGNFIKTPSGQVVCVDVGAAFQLEPKDNGLYLNELRRQSSELSLATWKDVSSYGGDDNLYGDEVLAEAFPRTISTIKALLYIKQHRPDIINTNFLRSDDKLRKLLSDANSEEIYMAFQAKFLEARRHSMKMAPVIERMQADSSASLASIMAMLVDAPAQPAIKIQSLKKTVALQALDSRTLIKTPSERLKALGAKKTLTLSEVKMYSILLLDRYVKSRGTVNSRGQFVMGRYSRKMRRCRKVSYKVQKSKTMAEQINRANDFGEVSAVFTTALRDNRLTQACLWSKFKHTMLDAQKVIATQAVMTHRL